MARSRVFVLVCVVMLGASVSACGSSPGSGLFNARVGERELRDPPGEPVARTAVYGTRAAISDPNEPSRFSLSDTNPSVVVAADTVPRASGDTADRPAAKKAERSRPREQGRGDAGTRKTASAVSGDEAAPKQSAVRPEAKPGATSVIVEQGDTLLKIANRHRVSVSALMSANKLASLAVEPGQTLIIPKR